MHDGTRCGQSASATRRSASLSSWLAALENATAFDLSTMTSRDIEAVSPAINEQIQMAIQFDIADIRNTLRYKYGCSCVNPSAAS